MLLGILNASLTAFTTLVSLSSEINYHTGSDSTVAIGDAQWPTAEANMIDDDLNWIVTNPNLTKVCNPSQTTILTACYYRLPYALYFRRIPHTLFPLTRQIQQHQMKQYLTS